MRARLVASVVSVMLGACQSSSRVPTPALLMPGDSVAMQRLMSELAGEMQRSSIRLGPSDPTQTSVISVLPLPPGPLEDRSLVLPTIFHLEWDGSTCWLVRDETGSRRELKGVSCRAAPSK